MGSRHGDTPSKPLGTARPLTIRAREPAPFKGKMRLMLLPDSSRILLKLSGEVLMGDNEFGIDPAYVCLLYTSPSPRD